MNGHAQRLLLVGGGHSHLEVLRRFAAAPDAAVVLTLVSPEAEAIYSGMLPGIVAGHYALGEASIALAPLAAHAGARRIQGCVARLDLYTRIAYLADGRPVAFDALSLDVGSAPDRSVPGASEHAIGVKPVGGLLAAWGDIVARAKLGQFNTLAMVGGGAGGVEMLVSMQRRLQEVCGDNAPRWTLVTDQPHLLPSHAEGVRRRVGRLLVRREVVMHFDSPVVGIERGAVITASGARIAADCIFMATTASAAAWIADSGLGCDERGFVRVNDHLQSTTHPFVFAAGDCATQQGRPYPKSGIYAVRHGPPLAENLRRHAHGKALVEFLPPRRTLALIGAGERRAIVSYGPFAAEGAWAWRWKERIDRDWVARYRFPDPGIDPLPGEATD